MDEIIRELKLRGYKLHGLSSDQIEKVEKFYKVSLPESYKYFLFSMGLDGGGFMKGSDCFYDRILELREYATDLLEEDQSSFKLKPEHYVFYVHQGYIFAYFDTSNNNMNPAIYYYYEGDLSPQKKYNSLKDFFIEYLG